MRKSAGSPVLNLKTSTSGGIQYGKAHPVFDLTFHKL